MEPQVALEVLGNLTDKALERELANEQVGRLLVATDLTESDGWKEKKRKIIKCEMPFGDRYRDKTSTKSPAQACTYFQGGIGGAS